MSERSGRRGYPLQTDIENRNRCSYWFYNTKRQPNLKESKITKGQHSTTWAAALAVDLEHPIAVTHLEGSSNYQQRAKQSAKLFLAKGSPQHLVLILVPSKTTIHRLNRTKLSPIPTSISTYRFAGLRDCYPSCPPTKIQDYQDLEKFLDRQA